MKKLILLALICTGFAVTTPFTAHALDSEKIAQYDRNDQNRNDQNRDNQNRDNQNRDNRDRDNRDRDREGCSYLNGDSPEERLRQRVFIVYYRSQDDSPSERLRQRRWMYVSQHCNRRDARRGYRIQILG